MRTNEGAADRIIRVVIGVALLSLVALGPVPGWGLVGLLGIVGLITGLSGHCPTYTVFGLDTRGGRETAAGGNKWHAKS